MKSPRTTGSTAGSQPLLINEKHIKVLVNITDLVGLIQLTSVLVLDIAAAHKLMYELSNLLDTLEGIAADINDLQNNPEAARRLLSSESDLREQFLKSARESKLISAKNQRNKLTFTFF